MRRRDSGFTLIEAVVALVILTAMLVMLYRGLSTGLRMIDFTEDAEAALLVAKARLAALGIASPLVPGEEEGRDGEVVWRTEVRPYADTDADLGVGQTRAYWAIVTVTWRNRKAGQPRSIRLTTLKLGASQ
jgi:general secretion pathway protein I